MYYNNNKVRYGRCYKTFSTYFSATIFFFYQFYVEGEQITTKSTYLVQYSFFLRFEMADSQISYFSTTDL